MFNIESNKSQNGGLEDYNNISDTLDNGMKPFFKKIQIKDFKQMLNTKSEPKTPHLWAH